MLKKLLKYDLKWCFKPLSVFYLLTFLVSILIRIIESLDQSLVIVIIDKICSGLFIALLINIIINCLMRNWIRFIRNIYKDESYLTHTLPVSKNEIFLSKILTIIITLLTSFTVIIICLAIALLTKDTWLFIKTSLEQSAIYFNSSVYMLVLFIIITIFFEFLFMSMSGIFGIIIGHKSNNYKIVKSIIIGILIYTILSFISLLIIYIVALLNSDIMSLFKSLEVSSTALKNLMLIGTSEYILYNIIIYFISNKLFNQGINVD